MSATTLTGPSDGCDLGQILDHWSLEVAEAPDKRPFNVQIPIQSLQNTAGGSQHFAAVFNVQAQNPWAPGIRITFFCNAPVASAELRLSILKLYKLQWIY